MLTSLIGPVAEILDKVIPDKDLREQLAHQIAEMAHKETMGQIEINKIEAQHGSIFVSGWRPFLGWGLVCALLWHTVVIHILIFVLSFFNVGEIDLPKFDISIISAILVSLLGFGGARSFEKLKGVDRKSLSK